MWEEQSSEQRQRNVLPEIPRSRRAQFDKEELPQLNLYDDRSLEGTYTQLPRPQPGTGNVQEAGNIPVTSTPNETCSRAKVQQTPSVDPPRMVYCAIYSILTRFTKF